MYDNRCPDCGAYLDPNEVCDCHEKENAASQTGTLESGNGNGYTLILSEMGGSVNALNSNYAAHP